MLFKFQAEYIRDELHKVTDSVKTKELDKNFTGLEIANAIDIAIDDILEKASNMTETLDKDKYYLILAPSDTFEKHKDVYTKICEALRAADIHVIVVNDDIVKSSQMASASQKEDFIKHIEEMIK